MKIFRLIFLLGSFVLFTTGMAYSAEVPDLTDAVPNSSVPKNENSAVPLPAATTQPELSEINQLSKANQRPPDDPCLPQLYKDWQEFSADNLPKGFAAFRIIINSSNFQLALEALRRDGSVERIYNTHIAVGESDSPTPSGRYLINHIYCYPDVVFFDPVSGPVPVLYNGFFAPLLKCNEAGKCSRYRDLGIHGYHPTRGGNRTSAVSLTYGAISAGCIRVPDPCRFKTEIIKLVGIGPLKKNERGSYHWLNKPIEVIIEDNEPGKQKEDDLTLASAFQQGIEQVGEGIRGILDIFELRN